jgi:hypothetical protein
MQLEILSLSEVNNILQGPSVTLHADGVVLKFTLPEIPERLLGPTSSGDELMEWARKEALTALMRWAH